MSNRDNSEDSFLSDLIKNGPPSNYETAGDGYDDEEFEKSIERDAESEVLQETHSRFIAASDSDDDLEDELPVQKKSKFTLPPIHPNAKKRFMYAVPLIAIVLYLKFGPGFSPDPTNIQSTQNSVKTNIPATENGQEITLDNIQAISPSDIVTETSTDKSHNIIQPTPEITPNQQTTTNFKYSTTPLPESNNNIQSFIESKNPSAPISDSTAYMSTINRELDNQNQKINTLEHETNSIKTLITTEIKKLDDKISKYHSKSVSMDNQYKNTNERPDLQVQLIGKAIGCADCISHAIVIFNKNKITLSDGDTFQSYSVSITNDKVLLKAKHAQYSYYPEQ